MSKTDTDIRDNERYMSPALSAAVAELEHRGGSDAAQAVRMLFAQRNALLLALKMGLDNHPAAKTIADSIVKKVESQG